MGRDVWCHPVLTRSKSPRLPDKLLAVAGVSYTGKLVQQELGLHRCDINAAGGTEDDMFVDIAIIYCITSLREQTFLSNYCIKSRTPTVPSPSPIHSRNIAIEAAATNAEFTVVALLIRSSDTRWHHLQCSSSELSPH